MVVCLLDENENVHLVDIVGMHLYMGSISPVLFRGLGNKPNLYEQHFCSIPQQQKGQKPRPIIFFSVA